MSRDRPWWFPKLVDGDYLARLRRDYPDDAHLSDDALRAEYGYEEKYAVNWDHIGDAYDEYEPLADAYLALRQRVEALTEALRRIKGYIDDPPGDNEGDFETLAGWMHAEAMKALQGDSNAT